MAAIATTVGEKGYADTTVGEVAGRAGVSLRAFYEHFRDKEECYLAAYDVFAEAVFTRMAGGVDGATSWHDFIDTALGAYLATLDAEPAVARAFLIEMDGAGPRARARRRASYAAFAELIKQRHDLIRREDPALGPLPDRAYLGLTHGIRALVAEALESSPGTPLAEIGPDILVWISAMVEGAAAAEADRPR